MNLNKRIMAGTPVLAGVAVLLLALPPGAGEEADRVGDAQGDPLPAGALTRLGTVRCRTGARILCAAYSPNGKMLAVGCGDDPVHIWDAETGREVRQLKEPWAFALAFSPDGALVATGGSLQRVRLWQTASGQPFGQPLAHPAPLKALAFSPDGTLLASAGQDKTIRMWSIPGRTLLASLSGHEDEINALAFSVDGKTLASAGGDHSIRLWEIPGGRPLRRFDGGCAVAALTFANAGKTLISRGDDNLIRFWDVAAGKLARTLTDHEQPVKSLLVTPDGKTLVAGDQGSTIRLWDLESGQRVRQIPRRPGDADALTLSPDGHTLAAGGTNNTLRRWDLSGKELGTGNGHRAGISSLLQAPDGKWLASGSTAGNVRFWVPSTAKEVLPPLELGGQDALLACAPDGKRIAVADGSAPVRLIAVSTREIKASFTGPKDDPVFCLAFSPDGKMLAAGHEHHGIQLWDVAAGTIARSLPYPGGVQALAFAPDGKVVAVAGTDKIALWETATGSLIHQSGKATPAAALVFSPDGTTLAAGMYDGTIRLLDGQSGKEIRALEGHQSAVFALAFSPDGRILTSASHDRTVRLWEIASGQQIVAWTGHLGPVTAVTFLPGGRVVVSGSADTSLLLWDGTGQSPTGRLALERIAPDDMETLWQDLGATDVPRAYRALWTFVAGAQDAVPLLEKQKRVFLVDPERIQQLVRDLNDNRFSVRERAHGELAKYGRWIEGVLETVRSKPSSEEVRRRVEKLLSLLQRDGSLSLAQERLRARRLLMILEQSATPAARELLEKLSRQAAEADLRADAKASLARLQRQ
jgi:WD40 repeat protein